MAKIPRAIIWSGNIGTDLMIKILGKSASAEQAGRARFPGILTGILD